MTIIAVDFVSRRIATLEGTPGVGAGPVLTSLLYPIEVTESLNASSSLRQGWVDHVVGAIDVSSDLVGGALAVLIAYKTLTADPENLDVSSDLVSGSLTVLITYETLTADPENLDVSSDLVSGSLVVVINYVTHTMTPEGLDVSSDLVSGSLT